MDAPSHSTGKSHHIQELDGLRAIAALMVVSCHTGVTPGGGTGVDVFFVLSGWLITGILAREVRATSAIRYKSFLVRRARRLLPALALMLAVYTPWAIYKHFNLQPILFAATSTMDFGEFLEATKTPVGHTWSLGVEWQFYLLWPFIIAALSSRKVAAPILFGGWAVVTFVQSVFFVGHWHDFAYFSLLHCSGLFLGAALAYSSPDSVPKWLGWVGLVVIILMLASPPDMRTSPEAWQIPVTGVAAAAVIMSPPRALAWGPLVWLGTISYGIYLWHVPIWLAVAEMNRGPVGVATAMLVTILVAAASWRFLEHPILRGSNSTAGRPASAVTVN